MDNRTTDESHLLEILTSGVSVAFFKSYLYVLFLTYHDLFPGSMGRRKQVQHCESKNLLYNQNADDKLKEDVIVLNHAV